MVRSAPPPSAGPLRTPTRSSLQGRKRTEGPLMTFDVLALLLAAGGGFFAAAIGALHAFIFTGFMRCSPGRRSLMGGGSAQLPQLRGVRPALRPTHRLRRRRRRRRLRRAHGQGSRRQGHRRPADLARTAGRAAGRRRLRHDRLHPPVRDLQDPGLRLARRQHRPYGDPLRVHRPARVFGRTSIFGNLPDGAGWGRFAPRDDAAWVRWHEKFVPNTVLGFRGRPARRGGLPQARGVLPDLGRERGAPTRSCSASRRCRCCS